MRFWRLPAAALLGAAALCAQNASAPAAFEQAAAAFGSRHPQEAERLLRGVLNRNPNDLRAAALLGVVLDSLGRFDEAETLLVRATKSAPGAAPLWNNLGNHYLLRRRPDRARAAFLKATTLDPRHPNANLQLAKLDAERKDGRAVLDHIGRLGAPERDDAAVQVLRAKALYWQGRHEEAGAALDRLENGNAPTTALLVAMGLARVEGGEFEKAETAFANALRWEPTNSELLHHLGAAALRAGHTERAREVFENILKRQPDDADALYDLALLFTRTGKAESAVRLLARAREKAPDRDDILLLLARAGASAGFYGDATDVYSDYLKRHPDEDVVRRERGFAYARNGWHNREAAADLGWYVGKHPNDATGWYQFGVAESNHDPARAREYLTRALKIRPDLAGAWYSRAVLAYNNGDAKSALEDLRQAARLQPEDPQVLDEIGQVYLSLDQVAPALEALSRAERLSPDDSRVLLHYSRALREAGRDAEANTLLQRLRRTGLGRSRNVAGGGLLDFLKLPRTEQRERYIQHLHRDLAANPRSPDLELRLAKVLLEDDKLTEALESFRRLAALSPGPAANAEAGQALLAAGQYGMAKEFLERAAAEPDAAVLLNLSIATFHCAGANEALLILDRTPEGARNGDYYLGRAQFLDAARRLPEAAEALSRGIRAAPTRPDLYRQATLFLLKNDRNREALSLLEDACRRLPDDSELLLAKAVVHAVLKEIEAALETLKQVELRRPELSQAYLVQGIIQENHGHPVEAADAIRTAMALGENSAEAYYYLAQATLRAEPDRPDAAREAIARTLELSPEDPWAWALAGNIEFKRGNYTAAVKQLQQAVRLRPNLFQAHYNLAMVYKAMGQDRDAAAESAEFKRIRSEHPEAEEEPSGIRALLFQVGR